MSQRAFEGMIKGSTVLPQRILPHIHTAMTKRTVSLQLMLLIVHGVIMPASAQVCSLLGQPALPSLYAERDINIGAIFSIHRDAVLKMHNYTSKPDPTACVRSV